MKTKKSKVLIMLSIAVIFFISSNSSYCDAYSVKYKTTTNSQEKETINESYNSRKVAYITIDDGPSKYTDDILRILDKYKVKGTFFLIDRNMNIYPEKVKKIVERVEYLADRLGFKNASDMADAIYSLKKKMGLRCDLKDLELDEKQIKELVTISRHPNLYNNPVEITDEMLDEMYRYLAY